MRHEHAARCRPVVPALAAIKVAPAVCGAVYAFKRSNNGAWNQKAVMLAQDGGSKYDYFGISVALDGRIGVVGKLGYQISCN